MTCAIPSRLRKVSVIPISFTTSLVASILRSKAVAKEYLLPDDSSNKIYRNFSYVDVHVDGTERIAEAVAKYDVDRFVHVSSYNANKDSPSEFFATKVRPTLF